MTISAGTLERLLYQQLHAEVLGILRSADTHILPSNRSHVPNSVKGSSRNTRMATTPVVRLLKQLMDIPSTSEEEHEIGVFLGRNLADWGYTVEVTPISPESDRCNVYAYLDRSRAARTCLSSQMDTVRVKT